MSIIMLQYSRSIVDNIQTTYKYTYVYYQHSCNSNGFFLIVKSARDRDDVSLYAIYLYSHKLKKNPYMQKAIRQTSASDTYMRCVLEPCVFFCTNTQVSVWIFTIVNIGL